ncbi:hypothetical protein [Pseudonocardia acaciae]|nr:hypothetical protein [Pseudonocardia acaciae]
MTANMGWRTHFWQAGRTDAVAHGLAQGLRREWLDFPTDESTGELA